MTPKSGDFFRLSRVGPLLKVEFATDTLVIATLAGPAPDEVFGVKVFFYRTKDVASWMESFPVDPVAGRDFGAA